MKNLRKTLNEIKEASQSNFMAARDFHLFVIKQAFVAREPPINLVWPIAAKTRHQKQG